MAESLYGYFHEDKNIDFIKRLQKNGVKINNFTSRKIGQKLAGKTFVLTGELENMTRDEAKELIKDNGGDVVASVSKNTSYVLAGENPGSKYAKAEHLGVKIINKNEFLKMIE